MEIIKTYLENLFAGLPKTKEVLKMKGDLLANMLDKYEELKRNGKTENEAIGIVISEFGNIDEIASELGIDINNNEDVGVPTVTMDDARTYLQLVKKMGKLIAFGVMLCILAPITLILLASDEITLNMSSELRIFIGVVTLFLFVAPATGMFVFAGIKLEKYEFLNHKIITPPSVKQMVQEEKDAFDNRFTISLIVSIILYIFSPTFLIGASLLEGDNESYLIIGVAIILFVASIGTFIIVKEGLVRGSHNLLLRLGDYKSIDKKSKKIENAIAGIYWPIVCGIYFLWSFLGNAWHISWITFLVAGVIYGGIESFLQISNKD